VGSPRLPEVGKRGKEASRKEVLGPAHEGAKVFAIFADKRIRRH
jgi:hypothetical protein